MTKASGKPTTARQTADDERISVAGAIFAEWPLEPPTAKVQMEDGNFGLREP